MTRSREPRSLLVPDSEESEAVRTLLAAGATEEIDYDFDRGLAAHLGAIGAVPGPSHPDPTGSAVAKTAGSGLSSKAVLLLIGAPVAAVSLGVALSLGGFGGLSGAAGSAAPVVTSLGAPSDPAAAVTPHEAALAQRHVPEVAEAHVPFEDQRIARPLPHRGDGRRNPSKAPAEPLVTLSERTTPGDVGPRAEGPTSAARISGSESPGPAAIPSTAASAAAERAAEAALEEARERRKASAAEAARLADQRLEREMSALSEAKHSLAEDPARAVSLARQGDRDFPHGVFAEERRHILILALIRLGRLEEARRLAAPYLEQHPDSPFARRVRTELDGARAPR